VCVTFAIRFCITFFEIQNQDESRDFSWQLREFFMLLGSMAVFPDISKIVDDKKSTFFVTPLIKLKLTPGVHLHIFV